MLFDRFCEVSITNTSNKIFKDLRTKFEVVKSSIAKDNITKIDIYNLSSSSQSFVCQKDSVVNLRVGYVNDVVSNISTSDITKVITTNTETDSVTTIYATEGAFSLKYNYITISTTNSVSLSQLADIISSQSGVNFNIRDIDFSQKTQGAYSDSGSLDSVLDALASYFNFTWSFQNNQIVIKGVKSSSVTSFKLNSNTGLIFNPESQKKLLRSIEKSKKDLDSNSVKLTSLMLPKLQIHDILEVESRSVNGVFKINTLKHEGDTHGNQWYTHLEVTNTNDYSDYN